MKRISDAYYELFARLCRRACDAEVVREFRFHPTRRWRFDFALPEHRVAVEVEGGVWIGGRHTSPKGFIGDIEKYNTATLMGWRVLRVTPDKLCKAETIEMIRSAVSGYFNPFRT